jgi:hypothetical protein
MLLSQPAVIGHSPWYMGPRVRKDDYSFWCGGDGKLWHARLFLYRTSLTNLVMLATTLSHARRHTRSHAQRHPPVMPGHDRVSIFGACAAYALNSACYTICCSLNHAQISFITSSLAAGSSLSISWYRSG